MTDEEKKQTFVLNTVTNEVMRWFPSLEDLRVKLNKKVSTELVYGIPKAVADKLRGNPDEAIRFLRYAKIDEMQNYVSGFDGDEPESPAPDRMAHVRAGKKPKTATPTAAPQE